MAPAGSASAPLSPAGGVQVLQGVSLRALKNGIPVYRKKVTCPGVRHVTFFSLVRQVGLILEGGLINSFHVLPVRYPKVITHTFGAPYPSP
jgi:hypothetical protein